MKPQIDKYAGAKAILASLAAIAESTNDGDVYCAEVTQALSGMIDIETLILFVVIDETTLEMQASHGRAFAHLDQGRFLKTHRKTPVTDAIRLQTIQAWSNTSKILLEYPDLINWPRMMHSVVGVPIIRRGKSLAGCAFVLKNEFNQADRDAIVEILRKVSELIFSVHQKR